MDISQRSFQLREEYAKDAPLSALIYVLCAEVLGIEIRKNEKIVGYKYNRNKDEHKLTQYADDKVVCLTTENSILELFRSLNRYEMATNSRINKDKTIGVWIGAFRNKDKDFAGIQWKNEPVESLGVLWEMIDIYALLQGSMLSKIKSKSRCLIGAVRLCH